MHPPKAETKSRPLQRTRAATATELLIERRDAALVLALKGPATRTALSPDACVAGIEAIGAAEADSAICAIVLRGDGAHFCVGGNVQRLLSMRQREPAEQAESMENFHGLVEAMRTSPKPVIGAVEGWAAGGSAALALAGARPGAGGLRQRPRARDRARGLVAMSPQAIASAKELIDTAPDRELRAQLDAERDHFVRNLHHRNGGEGLQAFVDKRPPKFYAS